MNASSALSAVRFALFTLTSLAAVATCAAQPAAAPAAEAPPTERGEPAVKYTVIEDEGSRIDELRVRGQTQRITVTPKGPGKKLAPYEILGPGGSQDLHEAPNGAKGATGKRVWHVLSF